MLVHHGVYLSAAHRSLLPPLVLLSSPAWHPPSGRLILCKTRPLEIGNQSKVTNDNL